MTNDPTLTAARSILADRLRELRNGLDGLTADQLNTRPGGDDTNAVAVLAMHALASTRSWLSLAVGVEQPPRDRPAEFATEVSDAGGFLVDVESQVAACLRILDDADGFDPARAGLAPWRSGPERDEPVTAAWALLHALEHLSEHVGHAQLTRQLLTR